MDELVDRARDAQEAYEAMGSQALFRSRLPGLSHGA
jgi:hypothetical protein